MPKTRSRIDKKNSVTFKLVHRSQRDPLTADESAPQHVLVECTTKQKRSKAGPPKSKDEQRKYGIYYDDDYDYMQHIKATSEFATENEWEPVVNKSKGQKNVMLPSSLFASAVEEDEGMLNKAALPVGPRPDWDPEVVAAMDEDFNFEDPENQIDDDFVTQALRAPEPGSGGVSGETIDDDEDWEDEEEDFDSTGALSDVEEEDEDGSGDKLFAKEETKSHFTNYSISSSVMRRNKGLTLLDERFETLFENEYGDDNEIGALDVEELDGHVDPGSSDIFNYLLEDLEKSKKCKKSAYEVEVDKERAQRLYNEQDDLVDIEVEESGKHNKEDQYDCESILSTYSNLYNHPKLIYEPKQAPKIKINPRTGIPCGVLSKPGLTLRNLKQLDKQGEAGLGFDARSILSATTKLSQLSLRPKDETPQERKARKTALKGLRKERRMEKKANQIAFKQENQRLDQEMRNVRQNLACVKLV